MVWVDYGSKKQFNININTNSKGDDYIEECNKILKKVLKYTDIYITITKSKSSEKWKKAKENYNKMMGDSKQLKDLSNYINLKDVNWEKITLADLNPILVKLSKDVTKELEKETNEKSGSDNDNQPGNSKQTTKNDPPVKEKDKNNKTEKVNEKNNSDKNMTKGSVQAPIQTQPPQPAQPSPPSSQTSDVVSIVQSALSGVSSPSTEKGRKRLPNGFKVEVWNKYFGDKNTGFCYVCLKQLKMTDYAVVPDSSDVKTSAGTYKVVCKKDQKGVESSESKNLETYKKLYMEKNNQNKQQNLQKAADKLKDIYQIAESLSSPAESIEMLNTIKIDIEKTIKVHQDNLKKQGDKSDA